MAGYKKIALLLLTLPLIQASQVNAETSVHVKSSGDSHAEVNVQNSFKSTSTSNTDVKTSIRIESNGEIKTYESDKAENINIESSDGNSKVEINNSATSTDLKATETEDNQKEEKETEKAAEELEKEDKNFIEIVVDFFKNIFKF